MSAPGILSSLIPAGLDEIPRDIKDLRRDLTELGPSVAKSVAGIVADLTAQVAATAAATAAVAAAQITLAANVASIETLVGQQVTGDVGNASSSVTIGTSAGNYGVVSFTVPAGFTQAHVSAVSAMYSDGMVAAIVRTQIAGVNGIDMYAFTNAAYASATATLARKFAVTAGQVFTVASVANTGASTTSAYIATSATVTYYR